MSRCWNPMIDLGLILTSPINALLRTCRTSCFTSDSSLLLLENRVSVEWKARMQDVNFFSPFLERKSGENPYYLLLDTFSCLMDVGIYILFIFSSFGIVAVEQIDLIFTSAQSGVRRQSIRSLKTKCVWVWWLPWQQNWLNFRCHFVAFLIAPGWPIAFKFVSWKSIMPMIGYHGNELSCLPLICLKAALELIKI